MRSPAAAYSTTVPRACGRERHLTRTSDPRGQVVSLRRRPTRSSPSIFGQKNVALRPVIEHRRGYLRAVCSTCGSTGATRPHHQSNLLAIQHVAERKGALHA